MASGATDIGRDLIFQKLRQHLYGVNGPLYYFHNLLYGGPYTVGGSAYNFNPAVSGYTLIFMQPPDLSGYVNNGVINKAMLGDATKMMCFVAVDFTPPSIQATASELPSRSGSLPYATEVSGTGQLSISFLDDTNEHIFGFHKTWISYIEDITRGARTYDGTSIAPDPKYYTPGSANFGQIDYATTAYVTKFKPTMGTSSNDIIYIGKATGIFPINSADKEVIGRRDGPELVTMTYNYPCANYRQWSMGSSSPGQDFYIVQEYLSDIQSQYLK